MKLKQRAGDFRVRELLREDFVVDRGDFVVYRVTKRKLTTQEAIDVLAAEAGVEAADVGVAGLKDRQAITIQHMSVPGGRTVELRAKELLIEPIGRSHVALSSEASLGNAFEIVARDLERGDVAMLRAALPLVREHGVLNYFDEQRFGNVKHGQGWIALDLMKGAHEGALKALLTARSPQDDVRRKRFKERVRDLWGDWRECRDEAGRFGQFHSVFEHLARHEGDFAGAFGRVAMRLRLIHLYAFQSHLWNRAVNELARRAIPLERRVVLDGPEGPLVTFAGEPPRELSERGVMRLPGEGLEDVTDPEARALFERELERLGLAPERFRIEDVPGFRMKGEDRALIVVPRHLRVRPAEPDPLHPRAKMVRVRFELPRGAYATLVVKRLLASPLGRRAGAGGEERPDARGAGGRGRGARGGGSAAGARGGRRVRREERDAPAARALERGRGGPRPARAEDRGSRPDREAERREDRGSPARRGGGARGDERGARPPRDDRARGGEARSGQRRPFGGGKGAGAGGRRRDEERDRGDGRGGRKQRGS